MQKLWYAVRWTRRNQYVRTVYVMCICNSSVHTTRTICRMHCAECELHHTTHALYIMLILCFGGSILKTRIMLSRVVVNFWTTICSEWNSQLMNFTVHMAIVQTNTTEYTTDVAENGNLWPWKNCGLIHSFIKS